MPTSTQLLRSFALSTVFSLMVGPAFAAPVLEAAPATVSAVPDARSLAERSEQDLLAGKLAELKRPMTAERAARLLKQPDSKAFYRELGYMAPPKLRELEQLEPKVAERFSSVLASEQKAWLRDVNQALGTFKIKADGPVKTWYSMLGKLDRNTEGNQQRGRLLADGSPIPATPGELNDLTRARVNLPKLDSALLHRIVAHVQQTLPEKRPLCALHFVVKDYATEAVLKDPAAPYKGRIHLIIEDVTGGVRRGAFELQLGPKHLTEYWDRHFKVPGSNQDFDIHDAVYKGVGAITRADHLETLGRAMNPEKALTQAEAVAAGKRVIERAVEEYQRQLNAAMDQALAGSPELDYAATQPLRELIAAIFNALAHERNLPEGLKQHQHPPL